MGLGSFATLKPKPFWVWGRSGGALVLARLVPVNSTTPQRAVISSYKALITTNIPFQQTPTLSPLATRYFARTLSRRVSSPQTLYRYSTRIQRTMASPVLSVSPSDVTLPLILSSYKSLPITISTEEKPAVSRLTLPNNDSVAGTNTIASHLSTLIPLFAKTTYTDVESAEIQQWLTLTSATPIPEEAIARLNGNLKFRTTILGEKLSIADVAVYARVKGQVASWSDEQRTGEKGYRHIVRWVDFVQNTPDLGLQIPAEDKVVVDPTKVLVYLKPEEPVREKKKEGAATEDSKKKGKGRVAAEKIKEEAERAKEGVMDAAGKAAAAVASKGKQSKREKGERPKREAPKKEGNCGDLLLHIESGQTYVYQNPLFLLLKSTSALGISSIACLTQMPTRCLFLQSQWVIPRALPL